MYSNINHLFHVKLPLSRFDLGSLQQHPHPAQCDIDGASSGQFYPPWKDEEDGAVAATASAASVSNESRSQSRGSAYSNDSSEGSFGLMKHIFYL